MAQLAPVTLRYRPALNPVVRPSNPSRAYPKLTMTFLGMAHQARDRQATWAWHDVSVALIGVAGLVVLAAMGGIAESVRTPAAASALVLLAVGAYRLVHAQQRVTAALIKAAHTDPLTGLLNRRAFMRRLEAEMDRAERDGSPLSLVVADLDDFKQINDRLGHLGGDMALERASGQLSRSVRSSDVVARIGGEEFAVLLPDTQPHQARSFAERARLGLEGSFEGTATSVTASFGIASFPDHGDNPEGVLNAADHAMYAAKRAGKNRTVIHGGEAEQMLGAPVPAPSLPLISRNGELAFSSRAAAR